MTADLESRWRTSMPPFTGATIHPADFITLMEAQPIICNVTYALISRYYGEQLFTYQDWHEHDGFLNEARKTSWNDLVESVASEEAMLKASSGEYAVSTAYYPESCDFLLRIYVPDIHENPYYSHDDPKLIHYAHFDLTWARTSALEVVAMPGTRGILIVDEPKLYFDRRYGG